MRRLRRERRCRSPSIRGANYARVEDMTSTSWRSVSRTTSRLAKSPMDRRAGRQAGGVPVSRIPTRTAPATLRAFADWNWVCRFARDLQRVDCRYRPLRSAGAPARLDRNAAATDSSRSQPTLLGPVGGTDAHFRSIGRGLTAYTGRPARGDSIRRFLGSHESDRFESARPRDFVTYVSGLTIDEASPGEDMGSVSQ